MNSSHNSKNIEKVLNINGMEESTPARDYLICNAAETGKFKFFNELESTVGDEANYCRIVRAAKDKEGMTALHYAAARGNTVMTRFLIEKFRFDINIKTDNGNNPLQVAIMNHGRADVAVYLINTGANVNAINNERATPLHLAIEKKKTTIVHFLLAKGVDIEAISVAMGGTPLQLAASCGHIESVELLLLFGANPNSLPPATCSAIVGAIKARSNECLQALLNAGADPNRDVLGKSPLAYAAEIGEPELVLSLLQAKANPNSLSKDGLKPIEHAAKMRKQKSVHILLPLTERISYIPHWTVIGIIGYHHWRR